MFGSDDTWFGGISNTGTLSGRNGISGGSITTFSGDVTNAGVVTAAHNGIALGFISTFAGGITSSGKITAGSDGIVFSTASLFTGSIVNAGGTIKAGGDGIRVGASVTFVFLSTISSFAGGVANSGTISAGGNGILVGGNIASSGVAAGTLTLSTFAGAITNSGTITAGGQGIWLGGSASSGGTASAAVTVSTFGGGISNSGTISASGNGIWLGGFAALGTGTNLNQNQQNVASAINNFFNSGGTLPPGFASVFDLTGANLAKALTLLDGEDATGAERGSFDLMSEFLNLMLDPYVDGRGGATGGGPLGFAPDQEADLPPDIALAYAGVLKAPPVPATFDQRWSAWGAGFGGTNRANGGPVIGSTTVTANDYGFAAGMDYRASPDTVVGFALAGGGTSWTMAQGLGSGRSDAFMAGVYGATHFGPAYLAASLGLADHWFTTNRTGLFGDQLRANFTGQSYGARLEGGYRFALPLQGKVVGVTPYAAVQAQWFHTPAYSEIDQTGGGFGLSYNARNANDTRSELGGRFDEFTTFYGKPLILRARAAWAHDWVNNPALSATFEALPGASFTVFGAPMPKDSALTSAGAQLFFTPRWPVLAKFDGEFAKGAQTYAGTGTLSYTW